MTAPIVRAEMLIRRPPPDVFRAFADPAVTTKFWFTKASGPLEAGKRVRWEWDMYGVSDEIEVRLAEAPQRLVFEWSFPESSLVEMTFAAHAQGALVTVTNSQLKGADLTALALDLAQGWNIVLCAAKAWLEHGVQLNAVEDKAPHHWAAGWSGRR